MDEVTFAVLGCGGIGRRTLEVSKDKDELTPVVAPTQAEPTETPIDDIIAEGDRIDAVLMPGF